MRILERELPSQVVHASAPAEALSRVVLWLGGTPHTGALLQPVVEAAAGIGREVISIARPGFGGARRREGRSVADAVDEAVQVLEVLELDDLIVVGFSGGGPHAIGVGAARPRRVRAVLTLGCIAPYRPSDDWFAGMADPSGLKAAATSPTARSSHPDDFDPSSFVAADFAALEGAWRDLVVDTQAALDHGDAGAIDDDVAFVRPWGFSLDDCTVPVVIAHGAEDRVVPVHHAHAIAAHCPAATTVIVPGEGHISVLHSLGAQLRSLAGTR